MGDHQAAWPALAQAYADATCALEIGQALHGAGHVYALADLGLAAFICHPRQQTKHDRASQLLQPLLAEADLLETLEVFFQAERSLSRTAERLHIHRHSLDYRLNKITTLTGLDPRQFNAATQLSAALLLKQLLVAADAHA